MRVKQNQGYVVYSTLSHIFQVLEKGGSATQKYDAHTAAWTPSRSITPYQLQPQLILTDPDGVFPQGDYTSHLKNVTWVVTSYVNGTQKQLSPADGYQVNSVTHAITITRNVEVGEVLTASFVATFTDSRRKEVLRFTYVAEMTTEAQAKENISLDHGQMTSKLNLSPFKKWGKFGLPVQLKNGDETIPDKDASYQWQWWNDTTQQWSADFSDCLWYVSGADTRQIIVDQDFIQDITIRVKATAYKNSQFHYFVSRLRRWYGQYDEDVNFATGKYIFKDSDMVVLEGKVTRQPQGDVVNPQQYFDMELFFAVGDDAMESVGYGTEAIIKRKDLQKGSPRAGILCRELSCLMPMEVDGKLLTLDDKILVTQIPTSTREV